MPPKQRRRPKVARSESSQSNRHHRIILTELTIEGFRSCLRTRFRPNHELSVLIGPNGAGKTNVLQAIVLLSSALSWRPTRNRGTTAASSCRLSAQLEVDGKPFAIQSHLRYTVDSENREHVVSARTKWRMASLRP